VLELRGRAAGRSAVVADRARRKARGGRAVGRRAVDRGEVDGAAVARRRQVGGDRAVVIAIVVDRRNVRSTVPPSFGVARSAATAPSSLPLSLIGATCDEHAARKSET
jgi:hypothetical protein